METGRARSVSPGRGGQAAVEFLLVLPLMIMIIVLIIYFGRLIYVHLAIMTTANDCVTAAAQVAYLGNTFDQGNNVRAQSLRLFNVSREVTVGEKLFDYKRDDGKWIYNRYYIACQVGYPVDSGWARVFKTIFDKEMFTIEYTFLLPLQPHKSKWNTP